MSPIEKLSALYRLVLTYGQTTLELSKYRLIQWGSDTLGKVLSFSMLLFIGASALGLMNLGFAFWLAAYYDSLFLGFFVLSAIYFGLGIIYLIFFRKIFSVFLTNYMIKKILKK
jgi:hypothetical protein